METFEPVLKDFQTIIDSSYEEDFSYYKNLKNLIIIKCRQYPSIKKLVELFYNDYSMSKNKICKEFYMWEAIDRICNSPLVNIRKTGDYDFIFRETNYRSQMLENIALFISVFFGINELQREESTCVKFTITTKRNKVDFIMQSLPSGEKKEGYSDDPDYWIEFLENYSKAKMLEACMKNRKNNE